jgi:hypothetical protein
VPPNSGLSADVAVSIEAIPSLGAQQQAQAVAPNWRSYVAAAPCLLLLALAGTSALYTKAIRVAASGR